MSLPCCVLLLLAIAAGTSQGVQVYVNDCGGSTVVGQNCSLICTVSGAVERSTITYRWMKNNGSAQIQIGDGSNVLSFSYLKLSDAGQYTCQVMVDTSMFGYSEYITVQIPPPVVTLISEPNSPIRPIGANVTLTCTMESSSLVDVPVTVNVRVTDLNGNTISANATQTMSLSIYTVTVLVRQFGRYESGNYSCTADIQSSFLFHTNSQSQTTTAYITVGPYLLLKGMVYPNNSVIFLSEIGQYDYNYPAIQNDVLQCVTDLKPCCYNWHNREPQYLYSRQWYYPNGTEVYIQHYSKELGHAFYRNRGPEGNVNLNIHSNARTFQTGLFCCVIPDANWNNQSLCANLATVTVIPSGSHIAGESISLTCFVDGMEHLENHVLFEWSDRGGYIDTGDPSRSINNTMAQSYLHLSPLQKSHEGTYNCTVITNRVMKTSLYTVFVQVPSVTANITSDEIPSVLGRRYTFTCYVSGAEKLNPMTKYDWKKNISGAAQLPVGTNSSVLLLPSLKLSDAGQYSCHITIQSHYLDNELTAVASQNVLLELPTPIVNLASNPTGVISAGSSVTLTCTVVLDPSVDVAVAVNTVWTGPDNFNRNIMAQQIGSTTTYTSTVMVSSFGRNQSGNYTCTATVSSSLLYIRHSRSQHSTLVVTVGVYLSLKGSVLPNNTAVVNTVIGERDHYNTLQCITDKQPCCLFPFRVGEWLFPDGTFVPALISATTFYRLRSDNGTVFLNRMISDAEYPSGLFCCAVPDANDIQRKACVNILPGISVQIYIRGANPVAGHRHILDCNVTGAENFDSSSTLTYQWLKNNSSQTRLGINSNSLIFTSLKLSDAGWYTCQVLISSPFLYNVVNATSKAYEVDVEVPQPVVRLVSDTPNTILSGSSPTLTCAVELDPAVDVPVSVATEWTGPDGSMLASAAPPVMRSLTHYTSKAKLNYVESVDSGTYTCSVSIDGKTSTSAEKNIVIGDGMFQLQLIDADICQPWLKNSYSEEGTELYKYHIEEALVEAIESRCECHFPKQNLFTAMFSCAGSPNLTTYRNTLIGTHNFNSTQLIDFIQDWVSSGPRINIKSYAVRIDSSCHVGIASMNEPECGEVSRCPCANDPNVAKCVEHLGNKNFATCINSCI